MSREIKFRAWNKESKIMCYDNEDNTEEYLDGINSTEIGFINHRLSIPKDESDWYFRSRYDVMQYTGLKDKNGKDIFEGDIIVTSTKLGSKKYVVEYSEHGEWCIGIFLLSSSYVSCEVIGNVWEDGELLNDPE